MNILWDVIWDESWDDQDLRWAQLVSHVTDPGTKRAINLKLWWVYPLENSQKNVENHYVDWENLLFSQLFSIANC